MSFPNCIALLMTATINPPENCPALIRKDPEIRLKDYQTALKYYLSLSKNTINKIIFIENSGSDLSSLQKTTKSINHNKTVEFISYPEGNLFPPEYGKGYGEMRMMDYALKNSTIINKNDIIWKATGRLILTNIEKLILGASYPYNLYCDLHNEFKRLSFNYFFDPRFYSFTLEGYNRYFAPHTDKLKGEHIESYFYKILKSALPDRNIRPRFKSQPTIKGISGSTNDDYYSFKKKFQRTTQQFFRIVCPWIWL